MNRKGLCPSKQVAYFEYDFAREGGAIGAIALRGDKLPIGAVIHDGMIYVNTALTSGGSATIALHILSANDIKTATAVATWSLAALLPTVPVGTAATSFITTSAGLGLTMTIAVATLLTGKITVAIEYY